MATNMTTALSRTKNAKTKVEIICKKHGPFLQTPDSHLSGRGCRKCGFAATAKKLTWTQDQFLERAKSVHGKTYDYSRAVYVHSEKKALIICRTHGEFRQTPHDHLSGSDLPPRMVHRDVSSRSIPETGSRCRTGRSGHPSCTWLRDRPWANQER